MSTLIIYVRSLELKIKTAAPYNHHSLQEEHGIKSLATIMTNCLTGLEEYWPKYVTFTMHSYNTFVVQI